MPIRNPFARRQADDGAGLRPPLSIEPSLKTPPGFERVDTVGSKASSAISIRSRRSGDTGEYKMSVVNDSGVYLPVRSTSPGHAQRGAGTYLQTVLLLIFSPGITAIAHRGKGVLAAPLLVAQLDRH